jgi:hypothetical protein
MLRLRRSPNTNESTLVSSPRTIFCTPMSAMPTTFVEGECVVGLTSLFTNQGLATPPLDFTVSDRVRAGTTCRAEILAAFNRLDGNGPPKWHAREEVIAEVRRVNRRYPAGTIRRVLWYDVIGRGATMTMSQRARSSGTTDVSAAPAAVGCLTRVERSLSSGSVTGGVHSRGQKFPSGLRESTAFRFETRYCTLPLCR